MDEKKTYYVAVQQGMVEGQILASKDESHFQFIIEATRELFEQAYDEDLDADYQATEEALDDIYGMIYQLGTEETKRRMTEAGIVHQE